MEQKKGFIFYESWYEIIGDESQEVQWEIIHAVIEYVFRGNLVALRPKSEMAFKFIKRDIDRAEENYRQYTERQRINGAKGGRPKKEATETQDNPKNPVVFSESQKSLNKNINKNINTKLVFLSENHTAAEIESFKKFKDWLKANAPRVEKMKKPFEIADYLKFAELVKSGEVTQSQYEAVFTAMENSAVLLKKYQSAWLTFNSWRKNEWNKPEAKQPETEKLDRKVLEKLEAARKINSKTG